MALMVCELAAQGFTALVDHQAATCLLGGNVLSLVMPVHRPRLVLRLSECCIDESLSW